MRPTALAVLIAALCAGPMIGCSGKKSGSSADTSDSAPRLADSVQIIGKVSGDQLTIRDHYFGTLNVGAFADLGLGSMFAAQGINVDFNRHSVILLSLGEQRTGGFAADITALQRKGDTLYVQGTAVAPGPDTSTTQQLTFPFCAVAVPKLPDGIQVLSDITSISK